jgi:integrase
MRKQLAASIDPGLARKAEKQVLSSGESLEAIAKEWGAKFAPNREATYNERILARFEKDAFPWLGKRPISEIKTSELLAVLRRVESRGALETTHRAMQNCSQAFRYAVATGRVEHDPTADLRGALPPTREKHRAFIIEPKRVGELL